MQKPTTNNQLSTSRPSLIPHHVAIHSYEVRAKRITPKATMESKPANPMSGSGLAVLGNSGGAAAGGGGGISFATSANAGAGAGAASTTGSSVASSVILAIGAVAISAGFAASVVGTAA